MGADDTTDKLFPHQMRSESAVIELPVPLQKSVRQEFVEHREAIESQLKAWDLRLGEALAQLAPTPSVGGTLRRGATLAGRGGPIVVAALGLLEVTVPLVKPEWKGPLTALRQAFGG